MKKIIVADYYGVCMGVKRAISMTEKTSHQGKNVTIFREIVHNEAIVEKFRSEGVGQAKSIENIDGGTVIIPAHGASPDIFKKAVEKGLDVVDATCPLVIRIHKIIGKLASAGYQILHFGDSEHDETIGIVGHAPERVKVIADISELEKIESACDKVALTAQTTASIADFTKIEKDARKKFPQIEVFNTICNATSQRQAAITKLAPMVNIMLVVGSKSSANSNRLVQISRTFCNRAYLIDSAGEINPEWFEDENGQIDVVGLSAGASTPDFLIEGAIEKLKEFSRSQVELVYPEKKPDENELALKNSPL
ncbi:MAG: 4-hydroxy-3-methylbut-2-enyl diphosphate reductase [Candidatus Zixiibacteriota bacterium]|nr:MAG: 4-hydroxy-3-methylbut-2-enyl diphosphate reductase [candidate division Zixibacteria bacterium]